MFDKHSIEMRYIKSLNIFFKGEQEKALFEVSEIGKEVLTAKMGPDVILEIHSAALKGLTKNSDPLAISKILMDANEVLTNSLMGYAMYYYSFMEMLDSEKKKREDAQVEINEKIDELERMNKLFVGRELRMIELKERIKELEKKIWAIEKSNEEQELGVQHNE